MTTTIFPLEATGIIWPGSVVNSTVPWGNRRVVASGFNIFLTVAVFGQSLAIPSYYTQGSSDISVTYSNLDGSSPTTTTLTTVAASYQHNVNLPVFTGRGGGSDVWTLVRLQFAGGGNDAFDADQLLAVTGNAPATAFAPHYCPYITSGALPSYVGLEGGGTQGNSVTSIPNCLKSNLPVSGNNVYTMKQRFVGAISGIKMISYVDGASWHVNRLPADGSSGIPLDAGQTYTDPGGNFMSDFVDLATGYDPTTPYLYEITGGGNAGLIMACFMPYNDTTPGVSGIDTTKTQAFLVRPLKLVHCGDSRTAGVNGTNGLPVLCWTELVSQHFNCQSVNIGIPGSSLTGWNSGNFFNGLDNLPGPGTPKVITMDFLINDIFGSETLATMTTAYSTALATVRAKQPTAQILVEGIKQASYGGQTFASLEAVSKSSVSGQGIANAVAAFIAGGDTKTTFVDIDPWNEAGIPWKTGGAFDNTNYDDGLHKNIVGHAAEAGTITPTIAPFLASSSITEITSGAMFGFNAFGGDSFGGLVGGVGVATSYTLIGPTSGLVNTASTNFTVTPNGNYTGTITPHSTGSGTFSPTSLTFSGTSAPQTFTYTPTTTAGSPHVISATSSPSLTNPGTINYAVSAAAATSYTFTGSNTGTVGNAITYTLQANGATTAMITLSDASGGGSFSPSTVNLNGTNSVTTQYTPGTTGTKTLSASNSVGLTQPSNISLTVTSSGATTYTFTGPTSGAVAIPQTYTLSANGATTAVITPSDNGGGGSFVPTTIALNGMNNVTVQYTPATTGTKVLSVTNNGGLTNPANINDVISAQPTVAPTVTIAGIVGGIAVLASTSEVGVTSFDYVQNGGSPVTGVSSPQNYTIANLTTAETFQVRSRNAAGFGPYSAPASLGGGGGLVLTITKPSGNPVLVWTADALALSYNVLRSTDGVAFTRIANPSSGTLTYTDTSEPSGTVYYAITSNH